MEKLLKVIEKVKERAEKFRDTLSHNEFATRYALIDPVLRALGWDTEDPSKVVPELSTNQGTPDYALYWDGKPIAMLEAKSLGTNLEKFIDIGFKYCWKNRVGYFVITNGDRWALFDISKMGGEKVFDVSILNDPPGKVARSLLALWYPAVPEVEIAPEALIKLEAAIKERQSEAKANATFADLLKKDLKFKTPPSKIILPHGEVIENPHHWIELLRFLAKKLNKKHVPLLYPGSTSNYVINFKPIHPDGGKFYSPEKVGDVWIEKSWSSNQIVKITAHVFKLLGFSPDEVIIEW